MKLRILQTPVRFYPYIGGVENHVYYLSEQLIKRGYEVEVICANEPRTNPREIIKGIKVRRLGYLLKIANTNISLGLPLSLFRARYDIAHAHMPTPWTADWTIIIAKLRGKKSVLTVHNDMSKPSLLGRLVTKLYLNTLFRLTLKLADRIIIVNPSWPTSFKETAHLFKPYASKIMSIPNGVDTTLFKPSPTNPSANTILFVSILDIHHKFKGFDYLLSAFVKVKKALPDSKLVVVGEGELKVVYEAKAHALGLKDSVEFVGQKTQAETVAYYQSAGVFVLPSTTIEGFGIVLLEALSCGLPVVATNITGLTDEIETNDAGIIVAPSDVDALSAAIIKMLSNPSLAGAMRKRSRQLVERSYSWDKVATNITKLYEEITI